MAIGVDILLRFNMMVKKYWNIYTKSHQGMGGVELVSPPALEGLTRRGVGPELGVGKAEGAGEPLANIVQKNKKQPTTKQQFFASVGFSYP